MKNTICKLGVLVVLCACLQLSQANDNAAIQKISEQCIKETSVTADQAKIILADDLDSVDPKDFTENMKCFLLCFYKKIGIFSADGKPVTAELIKFMEERFPKNKDKVKPAMTKCGAITDANPCLAIYKFEVCMAEAIEG